MFALRASSGSSPTAAAPWSRGWARWPRGPTRTAAAGASARSECASRAGSRSPWPSSRRCWPPCSASPACRRALGATRRAGLGLDPGDLARVRERSRADLRALGLRFSEDRGCPRERFERPSPAAGRPADRTRGQSGPVSRTTHGRFACISPSFAARAARCPPRPARMKVAMTGDKRNITPHPRSTVSERLGRRSQVAVSGVAHDSSVTGPQLARALTSFPISLYGCPGWVWASAERLSWER
jgi:hypothetical protein